MDYDNVTDNTVVASQSGLPTKEEYEKHVREYQKTWIGRMIPVIRSEIPRAIMICLGNIFVAFIYAFLRQFRSVILHRTLNVQAGNWLKIGVFAGSFWSVKFANDAFKQHGPYKGTQSYLFKSAILYFILGFLVFISKYLWFSPGWVVVLTHSSSFKIRGISFLITPLMIFNHLALSIYYVACEAIASTMMTTVFSMFLLGFVSQTQYKRFVRILIIASNVSLLISSASIRFIVSKFKLIPNRNFVWVYTGVFIAAGLLYFLLMGIIWIIKSELDKPLYIEDSNTKPQAKSNKPKVSLGFLEMFRMMFQSKLLMSICLLGFGYNFATNVHSNYADSTYVAYYSYLKSNPSANTIPGFVPTKEAISQIYKSSENTMLALIVIFLMLSPIITLSFEILGSLFFGFCTPVVCLLASFFSVYWSARNFYDNVSGLHKPIMFNISLLGYEFDLKSECDFASGFSLCIKIMKYAVLDYFIENVFSKMYPDSRFVIKGIASVISGKGAKMIASACFILFEFLNISNNARESSPIYFIICLVLSFFTILGVFFLHNAYQTAVKNNTYIEDSPVFGNKN